MKSEEAVLLLVLGASAVLGAYAIFKAPKVQPSNVGFSGFVSNSNQSTPQNVAESLQISQDVSGYIQQARALAVMQRQGL